eukprot:TRINITY_DN19155_c0_g1_i2.p1 TRINITY_DN19155_c0_g1~~TRINITY_DN19155_c0_g1_i2.p1  ORF type:complete len:355 (+),score=97.57 TRINITY_DN19155_c0_g1_i2:147-1067(+)
MKAKEELNRQQMLDQYRDDPAQFLTHLHRSRNNILEKRAKRQKVRSELNDRRSATSKRRMQMIAVMGTGKMDTVDDFGAADEDWDVYRHISKDSGGNESESEEEKQELLRLEALISEFDPSSDLAKTNGSGSEEKRATNFAFDDYKIFVSTERIRAPELIYQPSLMGVEQAGITELLKRVLDHLGLEAAQNVVQNIFVTGGNTLYPNFQQRLASEVTSIRPFQSQFSIFSASDPRLDAWRGASLWGRQPNFGQFCISRSDYLEKGHDYLKEHPCSNVYWPTPIPVVEEPPPMETEVSRRGKKKRRI